jgi:hypothetical protein
VDVFSSATLVARLFRTYGTSWRREILVNLVASARCWLSRWLERRDAGGTLRRRGPERAFPGGRIDRLSCRAAGGQQSGLIPDIARGW